MARKKGGRKDNGEGSHWHDKKNSRHIWTFEHEGRRYRVAHREEARAKAALEALRDRVLGGIDVEGGKMLLRDFLPRYITEHTATEQNKESTEHDAHKRADYYILPTLGEYRLCDLTHKIGQAWVRAAMEHTTRRGTRWSLGSIRQARNLLDRAMDGAVAAGYIESNPMSLVKVPRRRRAEGSNVDEETLTNKAFTPEQEQRFLAEVLRTEAQHGLYLLYLLALRLGLRRGELLGLRWKDVDLDAKVLRVRQNLVRLDNEVLLTTPKTQSSRRDLPLTDDLVALLSERKRAIGDAATGNTLVFPNDDGGPRQPNSISQHFRRTCKRVGLDGFAFHSLRSAAITNWRRNEVDQEVTMALAGHSTFKVTAEEYSDAQMDRKRAAIEKGRKPV